jgi:hypothetical protein
MPQIDTCDTSGTLRQLVFEEFTLGGVPLRVEHARVPIEEVHFDPENPRLKYMKLQHPGESDQDLLFKNNNDTALLKKDIFANGVLDPIYVRAKEGGGYIVVEGNRRTACVKSLHAEHPDDPRFCTIPARIMPEETTKEQEALLMASFHVTGKLKWDPMEKAGHIYTMYRTLNVPMDDMIIILHMGQPAIKQAARSYELLEQFKTIDNGKYTTEASRKWSHFNEMLKIKKFRQEDAKGNEWGENYCRWVGEGRLPRAEDVRTLEKIWANRAAKSLFINEESDVAFAKAVRHLDAANPGRNSKFFAELEKIIALAKAASVAEIEMVKGNDNARSIVLEAHQGLEAFMELAGIRLSPTPAPRRAA